MDNLGEAVGAFLLGAVITTFVIASSLSQQYECMEEAVNRGHAVHDLDGPGVVWRND